MDQKYKIGDVVEFNLAGYGRNSKGIIVEEVKGGYLIKLVLSEWDECYFVRFDQIFS